MDRAALNELTKGDLIELLLAQETRHAAEMAALRERIAKSAAPGRAEQWQQRQATVQRRAEETAADRQPAAAVWQADGRAAWPSGRDPASHRNSRRHR